MDFFAEQGVNVMDWTDRSPDLNPIENVWAMMSRDVYRNGKQYDSVSALTSAVIKSVEEHTARNIGDLDRLHATPLNRSPQNARKQDTLLVWLAFQILIAI